MGNNISNNIYKNDSDSYQNFLTPDEIDYRRRKGAILKCKKAILYTLWIGKILGIHKDINRILAKVLWNTRNDIKIWIIYSV